MNIEIALKKAFATVFHFYLKSHSFHLNVEGPDFYQLHQFLDDIYKDVFESVDGLAETIRTLDIYCPANLTRISELSELQDQTLIPRAQLMIEELSNDNETVLSSLNTAFRLCEQNHPGVANFLRDRIQKHEDWGWRLRSVIKKSRG